MTEDRPPAARAFLGAGPTQPAIRHSGKQPSRGPCARQRFLPPSRTGRSPSAADTSSVAARVLALRTRWVSACPWAGQPALVHPLRTREWPLRFLWLGSYPTSRLEVHGDIGPFIATTRTVHIGADDLGDL